MEQVVQTAQVVQMEQLEPMEPVEPMEHTSKGNNLRVFRKKLGSYHHGIDMGDGNVTDFSKISFNNYSINTRSMDEFAQGESVHIYKEVPSYQRDEIIYRALIAKDLGFGEYNLLSNNCEHFVNWCITGEKRSKQVDDFKSKLRSKFGPLIGGMIWMGGYFACSLFPADWIMDSIEFFSQFF